MNLIEIYHRAWGVEFIGPGRADRCIAKYGGHQFRLKKIGKLKTVSGDRGGKTLNHAAFQCVKCQIHFIAYSDAKPMVNKNDIFRI